MNHTAFEWASKATSHAEGHASLLTTRCRRVTVLAVALLWPIPATAQLTLTGSLTLVQEGPAAAAAGDPVPTNLATGATPFSSSDLGPEIGVPFHVAVNLNDGAYGNAFSWIGGATNPYPAPFAGIDLGSVAVDNLQSIAFGRSNVLSGDACGVCTDRNLGLYTLQYTQVSNPSTDLGLAATGEPLTGWADLGTLDYASSEGPGTNFNNTWLRHRYNFDPVSATGVRLLVPNGTAIDEIELYDVAGAFVPPPPIPDPVMITPATGFSIGWNGNDGDYSGPAPAPVPDNLALASNGASAFTSSDLGPQLGIGFHRAVNVNDGLYGNGNSWIGGDENPFAAPFAGVNLGSVQPVSRIAWGRDNAGGFSDRWQGTYSVEYTQLDNVDANTPFTDDPTTGWASMGAIELTSSSVNDGPGGEFTGYLRHEFEVAMNGGPVMASGIRLVVPATGLGGGTAIDELEVYAIPEPSTALLAGWAGLLLAGCLRRSSRPRRV